MTESAGRRRLPLPASLVGRIALWAILLLCAAVLLFWALFAAAADEVSHEVVDTRIVQFADQLRGYWASREADGAAAAQGNGAGAGMGPRGGAGPANGTGAAGNGGPTANEGPGSPDVGWIWQISVGGHVVDRSQLLRLTGAVIAPGVDGPTPHFQLSDRGTPLGRMRIAERIVDEVPPFAGNGTPKTVRVHYLVGISAEQYSDYVAQHAARLRPLFILALIPVSLAAFGMLAVIVLALRRDLGRLSGAIGRYEAAETPEIEGRFPRELQRLVDRVNGLLHENVMLIDRTRKYVSKIAHDINHPLAIMKNALDGRGSGGKGAGGEDGGGADPALMKRQIERMSGLVDRYSSLARAIGPESHIQRRTDVAELLQDVADGFSILYRRSPLEIACLCEPGLTFPVARHDLEAMVSNLVSNAHKFADSRIEIAADMSDGNLVVRVEDDGPGIPPDMRQAAMHWGGRLDEAPPGTGFGLTIVADIVALYEGKMRLDDSALGGLKVEVVLPGRG